MSDITQKGKKNNNNDNLDHKVSSECLMTKEQYWILNGLVIANGFGTVWRLFASIRRHEPWSCRRLAKETISLLAISFVTIALDIVQYDSCTTN